MRRLPLSVLRLRCATLRMSGLVVAALLLAGAGTALGASKLPRLPGDYIFPRGEGSPGPVTFSHQSHVDAGKPTCLGCHPKNFRILETGRDITGQPLQHKRFESGAACGACHDGKAAFALDGCDSCHRS